MLTRMYLYSTSTKLSIDVWLYLDRPGSLIQLQLIWICSFLSNLYASVCHFLCNFIVLQDLDGKQHC